MTKVTYHGFLQTVVRYFESRERAEQWMKQTGVKAWRVTIEEATL